MAVGDGAHGISVGSSRGTRRAQGQKIVLSHKLFRRPLHGIHIQPPGHPGVIFFIKRRIDGVVVDAVQVGLGMGGIAGVELLRHHPGAQHPDIRGQVLVDGQRQLFGGDAGLRVEVQRKAQRVDTGIGAAAPLDIGAAVEHRFQPILKGLGHAPPVGLHLKAAVVGAVVGKGK